ncbi:hypothetical protein JCGZ_07592 [Jatropha curcas]|uniref:Uncharacterized protein n=1 Tax=Jatropha curcas TaxID=180498 RepID=A0A067KCS0_JATCU|nr:serine/arginine repetitive matrix protein 2 [Jatropha curcas]KDP34021.1 hypothetical protein JCGZ_07592 [Jatropha curcas]
MSIALESSRGMREIGPSGYARGGIACVATAAIFESPTETRVVDAEEERAEVNECSSSAASSTTSSIGKDSDLSGRESSDGENCEEENEVQSAYKGTLDAMDALEEALPMRRGISKFYDGKSKSFTSLAEASSSCSIKDITKPENAYTRRRRNLLAFSHVWEKNRSFPYRNNGGGISKRPISSSKSTLALAVAMSSSESISSTSEDSTSSSNSKSPPHLPPLHPQSRTSHNNLASLPSPKQNFSPWRSFSVADLQYCSTTTPSSFGKTDH